MTINITMARSTTFRPDFLSYLLYQTTVPSINYKFASNHGKKIIISRTAFHLSGPIRISIFESTTYALFGGGVSQIDYTFAD